MCFKWWAWMLGHMPSQGRKGLSKRPRLPTLAQHCLRNPRSTLRSVVLTTYCESGREVTSVACKARYFVQATAPTSTSHITTSDLDHNPWTWWWKCLIHVGDWQGQVGCCPKDHEPPTRPWSPSRAVKLVVVPRRAAPIWWFQKKSILVFIKLG